MIRFDWLNAEANYADFEISTYAGLLTDDIIVGRAVYIGGVLETTFDYTSRTYSRLGQLKDDRDNLKVTPNEPYDDMVNVEAGYIATNTGLLTVAGQLSSAISNTTAGRIDLVYIDNAGLLTVQEGADAGSPVAPSLIEAGTVIAIITRGATRTYVTGADIEIIEDKYRQSLPNSASEIYLADTGGNYTATDVEDAFTELASVATGEGASILGIEDADSLLVAANVETALTEIVKKTPQGVMVALTSGSNNWTVPAGVYKIKAIVTGGGAGGSNPLSSAGADGVDTTFGSLTGGKGLNAPASNNLKIGGGGGTATNGDLNITGGDGGNGSTGATTDQGGHGGASYWGDGTVGAFYGVDSANSLVYGAGGGGGFNGDGGGGGGAGATAIAYITTTPGDLIAYAVGTGGTGSSAIGGDSGDGAPGVIVIEY